MRAGKAVQRSHPLADVGRIEELSHGLGPVASKRVLKAVQKREHLENLRRLKEEDCRRLSREEGLTQA